MESKQPKTEKNAEATAATDDDTGDNGGKLSPRSSSRVLAESMSLLEDSVVDLGDLEELAPPDVAKSGAEEETQTGKSESKPANKKSNKPSTTSNNSAEAVSVERKEELLLEARVNRLQWIHQVPLPYRKAESPDDPWVQEKGLASFLKTCHAAALMPSTTKVLSYLYGMEDQRVSSEEVANRIESLLGSLEEDSPHKIVRPGKQLLDAEIARNEGNEILTGYRDFWCKLQTPECASLVQGMRTAIRNLDSVEEPRSLEEVAKRLLAYIHATFGSIKAHAAWKAKQSTISDDRLKHSLESFLYGQCFSLLQSKLWTKETKATEQKWMERLAALDFVTPKHLDIACMTADTFNLKESLAGPIDALLSVDLYFSPYEKLQRILIMYHGINAALKSALNQAAEGGSEKLPSADDILPTIILTVLKAKPARLQANLKVVDTFCPPEYLRGEAGYAFTNLFGGVQFLLDLDMNDPKSLSISADEFRKGLEDSRASFQERLEAKRKRSQLMMPTIDTEISLKHCDVPASEMRSAQERGETVNLDWALDWQKKKMEADAEAAAQKKSRERSASVDDTLPPGFSRNYTFLTARPEDIRVSDLHQLLSEYRMLVHTSETLLGERASRLTAERKKKINKSQDKLLAGIREASPSLLPKM